MVVVVVIIKVVPRYPTFLYISWKYFLSAGMVPISDISAKVGAQNTVVASLGIVFAAFFAQYDAVKDKALHSLGSFVQRIHGSRCRIHPRSPGTVVGHKK